MSFSQPVTTSAYRPDIDGLRAVAVVSILLFHLDKSWLPGGFIGVDIFFVISGFLITSIILKGQDKNTFTIREFYVRRIRRIIPALSVVLIGTLIAGHFILIPEDLMRLSWSAIASQFFSANIYFTYFLDTSYFATDSELEPLLHIWSLGVEEQFYLIWPMALLFAGSFSRSRTFIIGTAIIALASVLIGELMVRDAPMFAYYMLPSRAFQLLAGALVALGVLKSWHIGLSKTVMEALGLTGLMAVIWSLWWLDDTRLFPGINAIPVTLGTAAIILAGSNGPTWLSRILSIKPLIWVGLISYSLYLWHWPVLAFARYIQGGLGLDDKIVLTIIIFGLSWLTYRFVEQPFRHSKGGLKRIALTHLALPGGVTAIMAGALILSSGLGLYMMNRNLASAYAGLEDPEPVRWADYVCQHSILTEAMATNPGCIINSVDNEEPRILLWGDSYAAHMVGALTPIANDTQFSFRNLAHSACPPILDRPEIHTSDQRRENCRISGAYVRTILDRYDTYILSASWRTRIREPFLDALGQTISDLTGQGKTVIVIGSLPWFDEIDGFCVRKKVKLPFIECNNDESDRARIDRGNARIRDVTQSNGGRYIDFTDYLCDETTCRPYLDDVFIYFDRGHLSLSGSEWLGNRLVQDEEVLEFFRPLAETSP